MKRKLALTAILACAALLSSLAAEWTDPSTGVTWRYVLDEGGNAVLSNRCIDATLQGPLTIPPDIDGHSLVRIGDYSFLWCTSLEAVSIPLSVTNIGYMAFSGCSALSSIEFSSGLKSIGGSAFSYCYGLSQVILPLGLDRVGNYAFGDCTNLSSVVVTATDIGQYAFYDCKVLRSVLLTQSVRNVRLCAFADDGTESGVEDDLTLVISEGVTNIGMSAFANQSRLRSVTLPTTLITLGGYAFKDCNMLSEVNIRGCENIGDSAFESCALTELVLPATLRTIGAFAFRNTKLTTVEIPANVTTIADDAFANCASIRTVNIPSSYSLSRVFPSAYQAITKIIIPDETTEIASNAYRGCSSVTEMEIPASVDTIGSGAFQDCSSLESVSFEGAAPSCGTDAFTGTSRNLVIKANSETAGWIKWNGVPLAFVNPESEVEKVEKAQLTVTNVVIHYVLNSVVPEKAYPVTNDTGFVNIITEVKSGGVVSVPTTWMMNYPDYVTKFGTDFTKSLMKPTGKYDGGGNLMCVWQDYVAGTDPTDPDDRFTASITMDKDGKVTVSHSPEFTDANEKALRVYTTYGKKSLTETDWVVVPTGSEADYNFFKVTVEMK